MPHKDRQKGIEYRVNWQRQNPEKRKASARRFYLRKLRFKMMAWRKRNIDFVNEWKHIPGCWRCPENNPVCLDFHHLNPNEKESRISRLCSTSHNLDKIKEEVSKCVVLCANCHRKVHAEAKEKGVELTGPEIRFLKNYAQIKESRKDNIQLALWRQ